MSWWSLLGAVIGLFTAGTLSHMGQEVGDWEHLHSASLFPSLAGVILGFLFGRIIANHISGLLLMSSSEKERAQAVERSAAYLFGKHRISYTEERVGVLIYISLFERQLVVFADRAAANALGAEGLAKLRNLGKELLAKGERATAITKTIEAAATDLKDHFPGHEADLNELKDHVVEIHPWP